jgi:hypothetical protein
MLKFAAIGVHSVPQKPDEHADRRDDRRIAADIALMSSGSADRRGHHWKRRERVAHHHREQRHAEPV